MSTNNENDLGTIMALPSEFSPHIVRRFKGFHCILDTCAGIGTASIALAKACHKVIGIELDDGRLQQAQENAEQANVKVTWIRGDVLNINVKDQINAAFLDPNWNRDHSTDPPTVEFKNMEPPIADLMEKIRKKTENIALRLPKETNLGDLNSIAYTSNYEIEKCYIDNQLKFYMIYFGALAHNDDAEYRM